MKLSEIQRDVCLRLADGSLRTGAEITRSGNVLSDLSALGLIQSANESDGFLFDRWSITPRGLAALEALR